MYSWFYFRSKRKHNLLGHNFELKKKLVFFPLLVLRSETSRTVRYYYHFPLRLCFDTCFEGRVLRSFFIFRLFFFLFTLQSCHRQSNYNNLSYLLPLRAAHIDRQRGICNVLLKTTEINYLIRSFPSRAYVYVLIGSFGVCITKRMYLIRCSFARLLCDAVDFYTRRLRCCRLYFRFQFDCLFDR